MTSSCRPPRPKEVEIVAPEIAAELLDAAAGCRTGLLWATALYAGLRYGELRALRWGAVDLAGGHRSVSRESWDPKEGADRTKDPHVKADDSAIPAFSAITCIDQHRRASRGRRSRRTGVRYRGRPFHAAVIYRRADASLGEGWAHGRLRLHQAPPHLRERS